MTAQNNIHLVNQDKENVGCLLKVFSDWVGNLCFELVFMQASLIKLLSAPFPLRILSFIYHFLPFSMCFLYPVKIYDF